MALTLIPYAQKIVSDYLRSQADVTAITNRIVSKKPDDTETPWVQVRQVDAQNAGRVVVEHLIDFLFQFDCYADEDGGRPQAILLGRTVRAALVAMPGTQGGVTVNGVDITLDTDLADDTLKDSRGGSRDRKILRATIWMHG